MAQENLTEKARRLDDQGRVHPKRITAGYAHAEVEGDHGTYTVATWFDASGKPIKAKCGCAWNVLRDTDHWCSHIRALLRSIGRGKRNPSRDAILPA